jgi:hypothetical protein
MAIETSVEAFVLDDPLTLQLRMRASDGDDAVVASTVWLKQDSLTFDGTMVESGDDEELAAAAERAAVAAVAVENRYEELSVESSPDFDFPAPDQRVTYVDQGGTRHEL